MALALFIAIFIAGWFWNVNLESKVHKLWGECDALFKKATNRSKKRSAIQERYGDDLRKIGEYVPERYPASLFQHLKLISTLNEIKSALSNQL
jgi:hypothetical protein